MVSALNFEAPVQDRGDSKHVHNFREIRSFMISFVPP